MRRVDQRLALDERHEPQQIRDAVALDGDDLPPVPCGTRLRHLDRQALGQMHHGAVLQVELGLAEGGVGDLEHEAPGRAGDQHVLILVRAELAGGALDREELARELARLLEREARRMQLVTGEAHAHRHSLRTARAARPAPLPPPGSRLRACA